jgi:hypothetical protein
MGEYLGLNVCVSCGGPVFPPNLDDIQPWPYWELKPPYDGDTGTRKLFMGWESVCETRVGRVEHLGCFPCDRLFTGVSVGYGHTLRASSEEGETSSKGHESK